MSLLRHRTAEERTSLWCGVVALPAVVSIGVAVWHGLRRGHDFQWSGAHMLATHIDPYQQSLQHDPGNLILMNQVPNYLHELYVLLLPLGLLPFGIAKDIWVAINLGFVGACVWLLGRSYGLKRSQIWLLGLLLGASTPFRVTVSSGQTALLETFLLILVATSFAGGGVALGASYFKYSFSPVIVCYQAMRGRWSCLAKSAVAPLLGLAIFWVLVHGNVFREAMEPFAVSRNHGVALGEGDLMSCDYSFRLHYGFNPVSTSGALPAALGSVVLGAIVAARRAKDCDSFPALICASLMLFTHLSYDYVALVIPLAALLRSTTGEGLAMHRSQQILAGISIGLLWYVMPSMNRIAPAVLPDSVIDASMGLLLLCFGCMLPKATPALVAKGAR